MSRTATLPIKPGQATYPQGVAGNGTGQRSQGSASARRPRARDIARIVGVSETAVSFALNGRPGISDETRQRILDAVDAIGFTPNVAARALSGAGSSTVGFIVARAPESLRSESFYLQLIAGIQSALSERHYGMLFQIVHDIDEELEVYRQWRATGRVDGIVLIDLHRHDPRPAALQSLGMPAVLVGGPDETGRLASVAVDNVAAARQIADHLVGLGHRRIAYITGDAGLEHVTQRSDALASFAAEHGAAVTLAHTDFSAQAAAAQVVDLLARPEPPSAIVFENEVLMVAGVGVINEHGLTIPGDVAVVSFEDSSICTAMRPQVTALHRDAFILGQAVGKQLLTQLDGTGEASSVLPPLALMVRGSSALIHRP